MLPTKDSMTSYRSHGGVVQLGDKRMQGPIVSKGDTDLLSGVLHVPKLSYGLISIARLDIERYISIFRNERVWVVAHSGSLVCSGTQSKGLYFLDERYREALLGGEGDVEGAEYAAPVRRGRRLPSATLGFKDLELLHNRWAHAKERNIDGQGDRLRLRLRLRGSQAPASPLL
jgi:hypothetical protein